MRGPVYNTTLDITNSHARLAICLCLDTSGSMSGHPINSLNAGLRMFYNSLKKNTDSRRAADIAIISFGANGVQCMQNFAGLDRAPNPPSLSSEGMTPMGEAVNLALDMIESRRNEYKNSGVQYYHPWLVIMSDGQPNGIASEFERAVTRAAELERMNKLETFAIGIGNDADMRALSQFSPRRGAVSLVGLNFNGFFEWLSISTQRISVSRPGDSINLPPINNWGSINA